MQTRHFQFTDLNYFIEICRLGSIAQAGLQLGLSQPALSKSVRRLEHIVGARLLDRTNQGVNPTELGRALLKRAHLLVHDLEATCDLLQSMSGAQTGSVAMGIPPTLCHDFLPEVIHLASQQRPGLSFRVSEGLFRHLHPQLQQGELDFIISSPTQAEASSADLHYERLGGNVFVACLAAVHPLLASTHIEASCLLDYDWVLVPPPGALRNHLDHVFQQQQLPRIRPKVQTGSTVLSKALIMQQGLIGFLPLEVFALEEAAGQIVRLDLPWLNWQRELTLITRRARSLSPAAHYAASLIRHEAGRLGS